ncbi:MFS transporter [Streptomyces tsukubensis]
MTSGGAVEQQRAVHVPELLKDQPFRRYWSAQTVSFFGDQISQLAIPLLAVLALDADASDMGLLTAVALLPNLLFSLHAGVLADRSGRRRRIMILTDLVRTALILSLPVAYGLDALHLSHLYVVAFLVGTCSVLFGVCNAALFVSLVSPGKYVEGNSLVNGSQSMAQVGGAGLGGWLVQILSAPFALVVDALSYLVSALFLSRIAPPEPPRAERGRGVLAEGLRYVLRSPILRANSAAVMTMNFFNFAFQAVFVLYATTRLDLGPGLLGTVLGVGAVGGLLGSFLTGRIVRRIGIGRAVVLGFIAFPAPLLLVPLAEGSTPIVVALLLLAEFGSGFGVMLLDISSGSLTTAAVPHELRARVAGVNRTLNFGIRPAGALAGGWLGTALGLRPTLWIATAGTMLCVVWILFSPIPRIRSLESVKPTGTAA